MPKVYIPWLANGQPVAAPTPTISPLAERIIQADWQQRESPFVHDLLMLAAQNRANDMAEKDYFSHTSPTGKTVHEFIRETGYRLPSIYAEKGNYCESLGYGYKSVEDVIGGWLDSPLHRNHVTGSADFFRQQRAVGTGLSVSKDERLIWVFLSAHTEQ